MSTGAPEHWESFRRADAAPEAGFFECLLNALLPHIQRVSVSPRLLAARRGGPRRLSRRQELGEFYNAVLATVQQRPRVTISKKRSRDNDETNATEPPATRVKTTHRAETNGVEPMNLSP